MLKDRGQKTTITQVIFPSGVYNSSNVSNHDSWKVNLLPPVRQINEIVVHSIYKIVVLTSRDDILDNKSKEQLMNRSHVTFFDGLGSFQT